MIEKNNKGLSKMLSFILIMNLFIIQCLLVEGAGIIIEDGKLNVSNNLFVDSNVLFVDAVSNMVGIGTNSPSQSLEVAGSMEVGDNGLSTSIKKLGFNSGDEFFVGTTGAVKFQRDSGGSECFRTQINGDTQARLLGTSSGQLKWGNGSAAQDIILERIGSNLLKLTGNLQIISSGLNNNALELVSSDGSRLARLVETGGGYGWLEVDDSAGSSKILFRTDGGTNYVSKGNLAIGSSSVTTINSGSGLFESKMPKTEILTGTDTGGFQELISIRHNGLSSSATLRRLGLLFKLSSESTTGESDKMGGLIVESTSGWANFPQLSLVTANQKRMIIDSDGDIGIGTESPAQKLDVNGSIIADDFITRSVHYSGDAIEWLKNIKNKGNSDNNGWGKIDHLSAGDSGITYRYEKPIYIKENKVFCWNDTIGYENETHIITTCEEHNVKIIKGFENETFEGISVDKTIAMLIRANQQLLERIEKLEDELKVKK